MATDIPKSLHINIDQSIIDGVANELGGLELVIKLGEDADSALFDFMHQWDVAKTIRLSYGGRVREEGHGIPGLSPIVAHEAIAAALHAAIKDGLVSPPTSAFDMIKLASTIAANMINHSSSVLVLTDTKRVNHVRDGAWSALNNGWASLTSQRSLAQQGAERAMGLAFDRLFFSTPKRLAEDYAKGCAPERGAYLYLETLDAWYAALVTRCVRGAAADERFRGGVHPLPHDDELVGDADVAVVDLDDDDIDDAPDGGIFDRANSDLPPRRPGGGTTR